MHGEALKYDFVCCYTDVQLGELVKSRTLS